MKSLPIRVICVIRGLLNCLFELWVMLRCEARLPARRAKENSPARQCWDNAATNQSPVGTKEFLDNVAATISQRNRLMEPVFAALDIRGKSAGTQ